MPALSNSVENCRVAQDDCNTRQQKPEDEQKLLGGRSVLLEDGAGECGLVEAEGAPDLQQRGQDHAEGEDPDPEDHEQDVHPAVDVVVAAVVRDQHISVDSDGDHVHEGAGHVPVEEEWEHSAERGTQGPGLVDIPGRGEGQVDGGEEQVAGGEADYEGGGGVGSQLLAPQQGNHRQQVTEHTDDGEDGGGHGGEYGGGAGVVDVLL